MALVLGCEGWGAEGSSRLTTQYNRFATSGGNTYIEVPYTAIDSIATAVPILDAAIDDPGNAGTKVVLCHSRGCQIAGEWIRQHEDDFDRPGAELSFIFTGNPERKYGHPVWPVNLSSVLTPSSNAGGWLCKDITRYGDGWSNWPRGDNPFNSNGYDLFALGAAFVGMLFVHCFYETVDVVDPAATALDSLVEGNTSYYVMA